VRSDWSAIEALANALLKFEVMEYDQAAAIAVALLTVSPPVLACPNHGAMACPR
jgi:hypothetical protein